MSPTAQIQDVPALRERLGAEFFRRLPAGPGVYMMLGDSERLLYVGKAKNLRSRLRSYTRLVPGEADDRIVRMVSLVRSIRWEECRSESHALARETELLRGVRPPFNVAQTDGAELLFIALRDEGDAKRRFILTADVACRGVVYGCFAFAANAPDAFAALLRSLYVAQHGRRAPGGMMRAAGYVMTVDRTLRTKLQAFLSGRSAGLLAELATRIESSSDLETFVRKGALRDVDVLRHFYEAGPRATRLLRLRHGLPRGPLSTEQLERCVDSDLRARAGLPGDAAARRPNA